MRDCQTHVFRPAVTVMMLLLASPLMAQAPSEQPSTRASVLDQARGALTSQSVAPERSTIERGLHWYDNQNVLNKILGGWKGIRLGGGDFPAGAGMKFGVAFDKPLTKADPDPTTPNKVAFVARGAYSTRGYARVSAGIDTLNLGGRAIDVNVFGQYLRVSPGRLLRRRDGQPRVQPHQLPR